MELLPRAAVAILLCLGQATMVSSAAQTILFAENFESLALGPNVDEGLAGSAVWTKTPPHGWIQNDAGVPAGGVTEWRGWSFASKSWWIQTAADQQRSAFALGQGTVAVADPDEWDDLPRSPGLMNTFLSTPAIPISHVQPGSITLRFASSWRPEAIQTATLTVRYDEGGPIEILRFDSDPASPRYKPDAPNEQIVLALANPPKSGTMVLTFGMLNAGNNWWWAIDNVEVRTTHSSSNSPAPIGHWKFTSSHVSGAVVADLAGQTPGTLAGPGTLHNAGGAEALWLDGATVHVHLADNAVLRPLPSQAITLEAWVALASPTRYGGIIGALQDNGGFEKGWVLGYDNERFNFGLSTSGADDGDGVMTYLNSGPPFTLGQWHHVVGTYDGFTQSIYVNGQLAGTATVQSGNLLYPASAPYVIGAYRDDNEFFRLHGYLHEVRVYDTALSPDHVQERFELMSSVVGRQLQFPETPGCDAAIPRNASPFNRKRVLLIGVDGCRVDSLLAAATPNLDQLAASGAYSYEATTSQGQPTVSGPGWSTILTGVWASKHKVLDNSFANPDYATYPHFFRRLRQAHPEAFLSSIVNWSPINQRILLDQTFQLSGLTDAQVSQNAACHILNDGPDVLFLHFDELDGAGHAGGYHPGNANYLATLTRIDGYIGQVLNAIQQRRVGLGEDWLIIFCSDHGGTAGGSHGGQTPDEVRVPLIVQGGSTRPGQILPPPRNADIVPTILAHLGITVPAAWGLDGQTVALSPALTITLEGDQAILRWPGIGRLQRSLHFNTWQPVPEAVSPWTVPLAQFQEFFRLAP